METLCAFPLLGRHTGATNSMYKYTAYCVASEACGIIIRPSNVLVLVVAALTMLLLDEQYGNKLEPPKVQATMLSWCSTCSST